MPPRQRKQHVVGQRTDKGHSVDRTPPAMENEVTAGGRKEEEEEVVEEKQADMYRERQPTIEFVEQNQSGNISAIYTCRKRSHGEKNEGGDDVGQVIEVVEVVIPKHPNAHSISAYMHLQLKKLVTMFLPVGYPNSVSEDYLEYQIYDSLQAFSSSIAGLLSSRAVLQGFGVGDATASPTTAMLLSILQDSIGRLSTIMFAHHFGIALEAECKAYRFAADIFNDSAMILDCLSPAFPTTLRVATLCLSGTFRALCGVAGGGSKTFLSVHFAKYGNVGELNAKDSSQETVISLLGMLAGSVVVSHITSTVATWAALLLLICVHLLTNYKAVSSVCLRTLNRQRANIVISVFHETGKVLSPAEVSAHERIFEKSGVLRWTGNEVIGYARIGEKLASLIELLARQAPLYAIRSGTGTMTLSELANLFQKEKYILWYDCSSRSMVICLKSDITSCQQLKAWSHALLAAHELSQRDTDNQSKPQSSGKILDVLETKLDQLGRSFNGLTEQLKSKGWDLDTPALETSLGYRIGQNYKRFTQGGKKDM